MVETTTKTKSRKNTTMRRMQLLALASVLPLCGCSVFGQRPGRLTALTTAEAAKQPFAAVVAEANRSVVQLRAGERLCALATVVAEGGLAVTVASEMPEATEPCSATCGGRSFAVERLGVDPVTELAFLQLAGEGAGELPPIRFAEGVPRTGAFLASPDGNRLPAGIGILSTEPYLHSRPRGFLGVMLGTDPSPVRLTSVLDGSAAEASGLRAGDEILAIDDQAVGDTGRFRSLVGRRLPGDRLRVRVRRGDEELSLEVELRQDRRGTVSDQENVWGPLSAVRAGFAEVLQHDTVLRPEQCGGPVLGLDGRAVGINVSRAGRVETLALPAATVREALRRCQRAQAR